jgi:hypothetical protein
MASSVVISPPTHPHGLKTLLQTARAMRCTPDTVSVQDVSDFRGGDQPERL